MNPALGQLPHESGLSNPETEELRPAYRHTSVARFSHLLEDPEVVERQDFLDNQFKGRADTNTLHRSR